MMQRKVRNWWRGVGLCILALLMSLNSCGVAWATLPDAKTLDELYYTDAKYWNPSGTLDNCGTGSVGLVDGESNEAYVWNWFAQAGIAGVSDSPAVIAGIVGNMNVESWNNVTQQGANPFERGGEHGDGGYGLIQWLGEYNPEIPKIMQEHGWEKYYHSMFEAPTAPPDIVAQGIVAELEFLINHPNFKLFLEHLDKVASKEPESYAELFLVIVERAVNGSELLQDSGVLSFAQNNLGSSGWYQGTVRRREAARRFYDQFANSTTSFTVASGVDAEGWVGGIEGLQKEPANPALTDDIVLEKFSTANGKPNMIILHYTAGLTAGLAAYGGNYYPAHFTIDLKNRKGFQHFPLSKPSLAVSTYDGYAIQIEIVGCGYNGEGFGVDEGCMRASGGYSLDQLQPGDWDYLAYYLNAISQYTGVPLTSSVVWDKTHKELSDAEMKSYKGVLGHMHVHGNGKVDPGNIWPDVEAALKRNPSSTYNEACIPGAVSGLVAGGMNLEQAQAFMQKYRDKADPNVFYSEGSMVNISGADIRALNVGCGTNFLNNCPVVPYWFINTYTSQEVHTYTDGSQMAQYVVDNVPGATYSNVPKVYSVFSKLHGSPPYVDSGHTGIVLGIDVARDKIIVGEAGCGVWSSTWPGAHEESLSAFTTSEYYYAALDSILVGL